MKQYMGIHLVAVNFIYPFSNFFLLQTMTFYFNKMGKIPKNEIAIVKNVTGQLSIKRSKEIRLKTFKQLPAH